MGNRVFAHGGAASDSKETPVFLCQFYRKFISDYANFK